MVSLTLPELLAIVLGVVLVLCLGVAKAAGHDNWIGEGNYRNRSGDWCCGEADCRRVPAAEISRYSMGYIYRKARIAGEQALPSQDGDYWIRCFFVPLAVM